MHGFKGARQNTPHAATMTAEHAAKTAAKDFGAKQIIIKMSGWGPGMIPAAKAFRDSGIDILSITDITPIPHNGCRPRKKRRV